MALILQILEGDTPSASETIFATRDPAIIQAVARAVMDRLGCSGSGFEDYPDEGSHHLGLVFDDATEQPETCCECGVSANETHAAFTRRHMKAICANCAERGLE